MASCTVTFENVDGTSYKESFSVHNSISEEEFKHIVQTIFMELAYKTPAEVIDSSTIKPAKPVEVSPTPEEKEEETPKAKTSKSK